MCLPPYGSPNFSGILPETGVIYRRKSVGCCPLHIHPSSVLSTSSLPRKRKGCLLYTYLILTQWSLLLTKARMTASQLRTESSCPILLGLKGRDGRRGSLLERKQSVFIVLPAAVTASHGLYPLKAVEVHPVTGSTDNDL